MDDEPAYDIAVARVSGPAAIDTQRLVESVEATLRRHSAPAARICIALVDDADIAELNEHHLGHQGPTDVLTFDLRDDVGLRSPDALSLANSRGSPGLVEGEIVVSVETAVREAGRRGHSLEAELALYAVHGALHLLGYGDGSEVEAAHIHAVEDEVLQSVGLGRVYGTQPQS